MTVDGKYKDSAEDDDEVDYNEVEMHAYMCSGW
jgi:hypothetical protein